MVKSYQKAKRGAFDRGSESNQMSSRKWYETFIWERYRPNTTNRIVTIPVRKYSRVSQTLTQTVTHGSTLHIVIIPKHGDGKRGLHFQSGPFTKTRGKFVIFAAHVSTFWNHRLTELIYRDDESQRDTFQKVFFAERLMDMDPYKPKACWQWICASWHNQRFTRWWIHNSHGPNLSFKGPHHLSRQYTFTGERPNVSKNVWSKLPNQQDVGSEINK